MSNFEIQRLNMVESQVRPSDVTDRRILAAMHALPRERFVPERQRTLSYMEGAIPIVGASSSRQMLPPRTLALLIQLADISETDRVLHVGAGTGYATALISRLAVEVIALESDEVFALLADEALTAAGVTNVQRVAGPLVEGWPPESPYDVVFIEGGVTHIPDTLVDQLKDGGRLTAIHMRTSAAGFSVGHAMVWHRSGTHADPRPAFDASAAILPGFDTDFAFSL